MNLKELEYGLNNRPFETMTFGMGCFWTPESRFGGLPGVLRTRVGYAGGTTDNPTYRTMGDHTETLQVDYDPGMISHEELLQHFWRNHYPNRDEYKGRQYISLLLYHGNAQKETIERVKPEMEKELGESIESEIASFRTFTLAEARHQKYYLKRYPKAVEQLGGFNKNEDTLLDSTFAARLNGFVKGFVTRDSLVSEIADWPVEQAAREKLIELLMVIKW